MALGVRELTPEEEREVRRRAQSRTEPARVVERARTISSLHQGERVPAVARAGAVSEKTVRLWLKRFHAHGLDGLTDDPRSGRPPIYTSDAIGACRRRWPSRPPANGHRCIRRTRLVR